MANREHSSSGPHAVALVSLGYGGTSCEYSCCRGSLSAGVNADAFERLFAETTYFVTRERDLEQFQGAYVLDKRPAIDRHGAKCVINSPMLDATLPDGEESRLVVNRENLALMAPGLGGTYQLLAVQKLTQQDWRGLDSVSLTPYVAHWRDLGARVGRIRGRVVVWEDAQAAPPS